MATYTATDAEQDAVTWSLVDSGDDDDFTLDRRLGVLRFRSPPDYEAPTDSGHVSDPDTNNVYHITVRATDGQQASADSSVTVTVTDVAEPAASFSASGYRVLEGGLPVDAAGGAGLRDTVTVRLRPAPSRRARIPVTVTPVTAESGDYEVGGLDSSALVFAAQSDSQSFTIAARADADVADETIGLGFGPLPPGVVAGVPSTATVTIHDTPNRPSGLTATRGLGQVRLAWEAAGDDSIRGWQYRTRVGPAAWGSWTSMDGSEVTYAENDTSSVATYTAAGSDCGALTWTVAGADSSAFRLQGADSSRSLRFRASPDYEARSSPYRVTVQARGEGSSLDTARAAVTVRVKNVNEPGTVSLTGTLSLSPKTTQAAVDSALTASLSDPDGGVTGLLWQWQRRPVTAPGWQPLNPGTDSTTYTPVRGDLGARIRVRASYGDTLGAGRSAEHDSIDRVVHVPEAPGRLGAAAGDTTVTLSWDGAVTNGAAIQHYEYRRRPDEQDAASWTAWTTVPVRTGKPRDARSVAVSGLTNDTLYAFSVRGVNGVGPGVSADTTATPRARTLVVQGPGQVAVGEGHTDTVATYRVTDGAGQAVTPVTWDSLGGPDRGRLRLSAGRLSFASKSGPDYEAPGDANRDSVYEVLVQARQAKLRTAPRPVRVRVGNRDDPGSLIFAPHSPRVGQTMGVTLADPDGGATIDKKKQGWQWDPPPAPQTPGASAAVSLLGASYKAPVAAVGRRVRVTVTYDDAHGPNKSVQDSTGVVRANVPGPPDSLEAAAGDRQVTLTWTAADSNGAAINLYQSGRRAGSQGIVWTAVPGGGGARRVAVTGLTNDTLYTFFARARNPVGFGAADSAQATPRAPKNRAPTVTGPDSVSVPEGGRAPWVAGSYTGADPDAGDVVRWRLIGADSSRFQLTGSGAARSLDLRTEPDYEIRHRYAVEVEVRDRAQGGLRDTAAVIVAIENVRERGSLSLTPSSPRVGQTVSAILTDTDGGVKDTTWTWQRLSPSPGGAADAAVSQRRSRYPVTVADLARRLRATVTYDDNQGADTATALTQAVRSNVPSAPESLAAAAGNRQVALTWKAAEDRGARITAYQARWQRAYPPGSSNWTGAGTGLTDTVTSLSNGASYTFEVRAVNSDGPGTPSNRASATPRAPPCSLTLAGSGSVTYAENGTGSVATYTAAASNCASLSWSRGGSDASAFRLTGSGASRSLAFNNPPDYEARSSYRVTVRVRAGSASASRSVTVTVGNVNEPGSVSLSPSRPYVDDEVTATLTDPDGGITQPKWSWTSSQTKSAKLTVPAAAFGKILKASVGYSDNHGSGQSASGSSSASVRAHRPDPPPDFQATRGDGQVALSWGKADGRGLPILGYDYRYRADSGSWPGYTSISGRTLTIGSLTNGTLYHFQVRARSDGGKSSPSSAQATPAGKPGAPQGLGTARLGHSINLSWSAAPANGSPIQRYEVDEMGEITWLGWESVGTSTHYTRKNVLASRAYTFRVRGKNGPGFGPSVEVTSPRQGPGGNITRGDTAAAAKTLATLGGPAELAIVSAPNPFNPSTILYFHLPQQARVTLAVYNVSGQPVALLIEEADLQAGTHAREWAGLDDHGRPAASGLYLYRLVAGGQVRVGKLALIR